MAEEMYQKIENHEQQIKARSIWQNKNKEIFDKLRQAYAERTQEYEDILRQLLTERHLSVAEGVNLDRIAEYYNAQDQRGDLSDSRFRGLLGTILARLQAAGQIEILLDSLRILATNDNVTLNQAFPAAIIMHILVDVLEALDEEFINTTMQQIKAAGVELVIAEQTTANAGFIPTYGTLLPGAAGQGFATLPDGSDGGSFSGIIGL